MIYRKALTSELSNTAGGAFTVLFSIVVTIGLVRILNQTAGGRYDTGSILEVVAYTSLINLPALISLALFLAVFMTLNRYWRDSEMFVWFSAGGLSLTSWIRPVLRFALPVILVVAACSVAVSLGEGAYKYFNFKSHETGHHFEAGLAYTLPVEKFPLSVAWYTMFAGKDKKLNDSGELKQNYSSYLELNYPFSVKNVDLNVTCGAVPYKAEGMYTNSGFAVTNVALKGMTEIKINDKFSLPIFAQAIWNPCVEDAFLVFGVTLRP